MHILVTGASKGIGLSICEAFLKEASEDISLSICSRHQEEIQNARSNLLSLKKEASIYASECDVSNATSVSHFIDGATGANGPIDVLINNAGFGIFKQVVEMKPQEFRDVLATNLRGVFLMSQSVVGDMKQRKHGTIVTISSLAGKNGFTGGSAYCAAKFGVRGLMQSLFLEVRSFNIRVITIFPGSVETDFFHAPGSAGIHSKKSLKAEDVARAVKLAVDLQTNADISELDIRPTNPKS